jgi:uroporphyrin-III C-methyltransferase
VTTGRVSLVGAGPGDPGLLTLHGRRCLEGADVVIYDNLTNPDLLAFTRPDCEVVFTGKHGTGVRLTQEQISAAMIAHARAGRWVVRLKGGDPFVFGRGGEEALALVRAGVPFRVVPGLTSGLAGPALAGIPATTRETNHAIILAAGHRALDETAEREWAALAATGQPIILYMAMPHLDVIARAFQSGGLGADTPVTIIASATLENERVLETSLGSAAEDAKAHAIEPPTIIIVGSIAGLRRELIAGMVGR